MVLSLVCLPAISAADYFFDAKLNEWAYALTGVTGIFFWVMACVKFDEMRKAKRYIVFDTFLNEINNIK